MLRTIRIAFFFEKPFLSKWLVARMTRKTVLMIRRAKCNDTIFSYRLTTDGAFWNIEIEKARFTKWPRSHPIIKIFGIIRAIRESVATMETVEVIPMPTFTKSR